MKQFIASTFYFSTFITFIFQMKNNSVEETKKWPTHCYLVISPKNINALNNTES